MICEECNERPASVRYAEMADGHVRSWNLCEECARRKGMTASLAPFAGPLVNILKGLLDETAEQGATPAGPTCPECKLSYDEFRRTGKLGCGTCYDSFHSELKPLLRRIHGSTEHTGSVPSCLEADFDSRREVKRLRAELAQAVRGEEYERAAELRDLIRSKADGRAPAGDAEP